MPENPVSKTGLIASPKKKLNRYKKKESIPNLAQCAVALPAQFSLRPFGGLFNPYARGCSILCNHPGPNEVKTVVKQAKESWMAEGKGFHGRDDQSSSLKRDSDPSDCPEHVPEEFFRRYTGSDSRPMTPTPTVASGRTRTSTGSHVQARRCFTPDPMCSESGKDRKQLILDLRRSHSQETLYWNASSELSPAVQTAEGGRPPTRAKNLRLCEQEAKKKAEEKKAAQLKHDLEPRPPTVICVNDQDDADDGEDGPRRRGKRKKKGTKAASTTTYQVSQEPETQVATLELDSPNQSCRPSLIPGASNVPRLSLINSKSTSNDTSVPPSFITEDALQYLRRGLTVGVIENSFDRYMSRALHEAYRTIPLDKLHHESEALVQYRTTHPMPVDDNDKWLDMPRKYTRNSVRFTLPIDTYDLTRITPFDYVSRHIWISDYRKQLFKHVFEKYQPDEGGDAMAMASDGALEAPTDVRVPYKERTIAFACLDAALGDALGFHGTAEKVAEIKEILMLDSVQHATMNFRSWCGVVAFGERFLNTLSHSEDRCDEIEIADFESLERKFASIDVTEPLKKILKLIKYN